MNIFNTVDQGIVFVDCTGGGFEVITPSLGDSNSYNIDYDKIAYVEVGKEYGAISTDAYTLPQYTFYEQYEWQWEEYESSVEDYNRKLEDHNKRVEEYNQEISGKVYYIGTSEYNRIKSIYNGLQREEKELKQDKEALEIVQQDLGYYSWEPMGVISAVEIYW